MHTQYIHTVHTYSAYIQYIHTQCIHTVLTYSTYIQYIHTHYIHTVHTYTVHTYSTYTQYIHTVHTYSTYIQYIHTYRMRVNFRGTKLSQIADFQIFAVFIFANARVTNIILLECTSISILIKIMKLSGFFCC